MGVMVGCNQSGNAQANDIDVYLLDQYEDSIDNEIVLTQDNQDQSKLLAQNYEPIKNTNPPPVVYTSELPDPSTFGQYGALGGILMSLLGFLVWTIKDDRKRYDQQNKRHEELLETIAGLAGVKDLEAKLSVLQGKVAVLEKVFDQEV